MHPRPSTMFKNRTIDWAAQSSGEGIYQCSHCGHALFSASHKFDSKTSFPSFWAHLEEHVQFHSLHTYGRERIQLLCQNCGQHLGHLFPDARTPSQVRYCINADSITLLLI
ncbi:peptide-methionine (R)-S-oxide reductase [Rufibacter radiotolerans]|uniref:peptide-methionine (R)-S-oxide reductase n=1 Tax=Rufibacter radiotolerans TaxID=1379910 RepID=UPI002934BDE6|nr:peptide-methionine (R)-S-oxide reductase [Rufibacter radiotolerans]